jgi:hypothetical protein
VRALVRYTLQTPVIGTFNTLFYYDITKIKLGLFTENQSGDLVLLKQVLSFTVLADL